jgi:hypothetical protein
MNPTTIMFIILFIFWNFGSVALGIYSIVYKKYYPIIFASYFSISFSLWIFLPLICLQIASGKFNLFFILFWIISLPLAYFPAYFFYKYVISKINYSKGNNGKI